MKRPDIAALLEQQQTSASTPPWPCDIGANRSLHGDWHDTYPTAPAPLEGETLPELLLRKGAMTGPHRRAHALHIGPVRRFMRALIEWATQPRRVL